jgi:hypothetical protein
MKLARWIFLIAGVFGLLLMIPIAVDVKVIGQIVPPGGSFFYGSIMLNMCWQILYIFLSRDPVRYRPMMIPSFLAEASAPFASTWLYLYGYRLWIPTVVADGAFAILFLVAFWSAGRERNNSAG